MKTRNTGIVALIMVFWFVISFITNIIGPLIPDIIDNFRLTHLAIAAFIPTSFFVAYAVMSIPAGMLIERFSQKTVLTAGFALPLAGSLLFAAHPTFAMLLASSFVIGLGMAMLQTTINPLTRTAGGEENFAFFSVLGQLVFGAASFVSPIVYTSLVSGLSAGGEKHGVLRLLAAVTPAELPWTALYWLFAAILATVIAAVLCVRFPRVELRDDERSGGRESYGTLLRNPQVYLFFLAMLCYTATEQGIANWMSEFLHRYHGLDTLTVGAATVGRFWGYMSIGCLAGLAALKLWNALKVLRAAGFVSAAVLLAAIYGPAGVSAAAFPLLGFTISVMFSIIMSTALNSVDRYHGSLAGILCTGIAGGALGPLVVGWLGDIASLRTAMLFPVLTIAYITSVSFWARPLIENSTVTLRELFNRKKQ